MRRILLPLLGALALAGCGSDDGGESSGGGEAVEIVETDFALDPGTVTVDEAGETTFRVVNDGATTHALEIEGGDTEEETDSIAPGESAELTVELEPGEYELYCPIGNHREQGMEGTLVVGSGSAGGGSTTGKTETEGDSGYGG